MTDQDAFELEASLSQSSSQAAAAVGIPITIRNASSVDFQKAEVAVKDEGSQQVATAYFGFIRSKSSATETVHLPGGVESCIYRITPTVGENLVGGGLANNAPGVNITVSD